MLAKKRYWWFEATDNQQVPSVERRDELRRLQRNEAWILAATACLFLVLLGVIPPTVLGKDKVTWTQVVHNEGSAVFVPILVALLFASIVLMLVAFRRRQTLKRTAGAAAQDAADISDALTGRWQRGYVEDLDGPH
jgi:formate hydrogenlyase subunit 3/multisubunit Na+/H+ antiporter MnhD subunit